jgi:hypothetical protein
MFFLVDSVASGVLSMLVMGGSGFQSSKHNSVKIPGAHIESLAATRINTIQLAISALTFIYRNFGKDKELLESAGFEGNEGSDFSAAKACYSLSSILLALKKQLKKEVKIVEASSKHTLNSSLKHK